MTGGGIGYTVAPLVSFTNAPGDATGIGATAIAVVGGPGGSLTTITITNPGTGYTLPPTVVIDPSPLDPACTTVPIVPAQWQP